MGVGENKPDWLWIVTSGIGSVAALAVEKMQALSADERQTCSYAGIGRTAS